MSLLPYMMQQAMLSQDEGGGGTGGTINDPDVFYRNVLFQMDATGSPDGAAAPVDTSRFGEVISVYGSPTISGGKFQLNTNNDAFYVGFNAPRIRPIGGGWIVEMFGVTFTSSPAYSQVLFGVYAASTNLMSWRIQRNETTNELNFAWSDNGSSTTGSYTIGVVNNNVTVDLAVCCYNDTLYFYLNGVLVGSGLWDATITCASGGSNLFTIGAASNTNVNGTALGCVGSFKAFRITNYPFALGAGTYTPHTMPLATTGSLTRTIQLVCSDVITRTNGANSNQNAFPVALQENDVVICSRTIGGFGAPQPGWGGSGYTRLAYEYSSSGGIGTDIWYKRMGATPDTTWGGPGSGSSTDSAVFSMMAFRGVHADIFDCTHSSKGYTDGTRGGIDVPIYPVTPGALVIGAQGRSGLQNAVPSMESFITGTASDSRTCTGLLGFKEFLGGEGGVRFGHGFRDNAIGGANYLNCALKPEA